MLLTPLYNALINKWMTELCFKNSAETSPSSRRVLWEDRIVTLRRDLNIPAPSASLTRADKSAAHVPSPASLTRNAAKSSGFHVTFSGYCFRFFSRVVKLSGQMIVIFEFPWRKYANIHLYLVFVLFFKILFSFLSRSLRSWISYWFS